MTSTEKRSMAKKGLTTLPVDLDILALFIVQCPWTRTCRGSGKSRAIRNAGQYMQWKLGL